MFPLAACSVSDGGLSTAANFSDQPEPPSSTEEIANADLAGDEAAATETAKAEETAGKPTEVASADDPASASNAERKDGDEAVADAGDASGADADPQQETASAGTDSSDAENAGSEQQPSTPALAVAPTEKKRDMPFARLFSRNNERQGASEEGPPPVTSPRSTELPVEEEQASAPDEDESEEEAAAAEEDPADEEIPATASITTASIDREPQRARLSVTSDGPPLPGVREISSLYQLQHRENFDYRRYDNEPVQVASAAGLAALSGGRLAVQHESVDVACLKPALLQTLRRIETHFGRKIVVTSGYRNRKHNRRVGGARESRHMYCEAADIQIPGVSKWQIAEYARSLPGRGGVGTYCHTESVHVDIGSKRDWNWRCRRRK